MKILLLIVVLISNLLSYESALENIYKQKNSNDSKTGKGYLNSLNYYYGYSVKQDLKKAKELFISNNDSKFMEIYSLKIKELIDNELKPNEKTTLNLLQESFLLYKKTYGNDIKDVEELIYNWYKNEKAIKSSSNKNYKIIKMYSDIISYDYYQDKPIRLGVFEITTPKDNIKFFDGEENMYITNYDIIDNYLLYDIVETRYNPVVLINLDNFKGKFLGYHFNNLGEDNSSKYIIKNISDEVIIDLKSTLMFEYGGGYYSFITSLDSRGNTFYDKVVNNFLLEWDYTHNTKNFNKFNSLYANYVQYYNKTKYQKKDILKDKMRLLKKTPDFTQISELVSIQKLEKNIYRIYYNKKTLVNKKDFIHRCILDLKIDENDNVTVLSEMDNL